MEQDRHIETEEYDRDTEFMAWCSVCQLILIEDVSQRIAEVVAEDHINKHRHLTFVTSPKKQPYEP